MLIYSILCKVEYAVRKNRKRNLILNKDKDKSFALEALNLEWQI